jgi:hypothetical protein
MQYGTMLKGFGHGLLKSTELVLNIPMQEPNVPVTNSNADITHDSFAPKAPNVAKGTPQTLVFGVSTPHSGHTDGGVSENIYQKCSTEFSQST